MFNIRNLFVSTSSFVLLCGIVMPSGYAHAADDLYKPRVEVGGRFGTERSLAVTEAWVPITQDRNCVLYGDARMMGDNNENQEWNLGLGYRQLIENGRVAVGTHGWVDRRRTKRGSIFHQATVGLEFMTKNLDVRTNAYIPIQKSYFYQTANTGSTVPYLANTGIYYDTNGKIKESPLSGFDMELSIQVPVFKNSLESIRLSGGGFVFNGDDTETMRGFRARIATEITPDIQIGARFEKDNLRGSQAFLEAKMSFPLGNKASSKTHGLRGRLDESPERDVDVISATKITDTGLTKPVLSSLDGQTQRVFHVDNTAAAGGDGSIERPFDTLAPANAAANKVGDIIYVNSGDGTTSGMDQGVILAQSGQSLIGSGVDFLYADNKFTTSTGENFTNTLIKAAGVAPKITNANVNGDGVTVTANNVYLSGFTVDAASRDGIVVEGNAVSAQNVIISNVTATNNRIGIYIHGTNSGDVSAIVQKSVTTGNNEHGIAVYDDTSGTFDVDLGGGSLGSAGLNTITGNTFEDLAVEYDGRLLSARNNWWGLPSGPDLDDPSVGTAPQIYYGAPLIGRPAAHITFDGEWTNNSIAYDTSRASNDGALQGGLSLADQAAGTKRDALNFDGTNDAVEIADFNGSDTGNKLTVSYWINPDSLSPTDTHVAKWDIGNSVVDNSWGIRASNADGTQLIFFISDTVDGGNNYFTTNNANLTTGTWTQITMVYDGSGVTNADRVKVYKDGVQLNGLFTGTIPSTLHNTSVPVTIGRRLINVPMFADYFDGQMDDILIFNRSLSTPEVQELHLRDTSSSVNVSGHLTAAP